DRVAGEAEAETAREAVRPLLVGHLLPVGAEPGEVLDLRALDAAALEEAPPVEDGMGQAEANQPSRELELRLGRTGQRPVDPGQVVVLAVGVVVALLGSPDLV